LIAVAETPHRRNPLRIIVTKETQLRILWLVGGGVFFSLGATALVSIGVTDWVWRIAIGLVFGALASLWVSRQIAGPFYRIEKDLEALLNGAKERQKVTLREGDPLGHLADLVNELIERTGK
jgi:hypothetical protein